MKAAAFVWTSSGRASADSNLDSDGPNSEAAWPWAVEAARANCFGVRLAELECSQRSGQNVSGLGVK